MFQLISTLACSFLAWRWPRKWLWPLTLTWSQILINMLWWISLQIPWWRIVSYSSVHAWPRNRSRDKDNNMPCAIHVVALIVHGYAWIPRKCDWVPDRHMDRQTDAGQSDSYVHVNVPHCFTGGTKTIRPPLNWYPASLLVQRVNYKKRPWTTVPPCPYNTIQYNKLYLNLASMINK